MSFPNGELCVKRTRVGGKGRVSHTEEADNSIHTGCAQDCVCKRASGCHTQGQEKEGCVCVQECTVIDTEMVQACGPEIKGKTK